MNCVCHLGIYCGACHEEMVSAQVDSDNVGSADTRDEAYHGVDDMEVENAERERDEFDALSDVY